MNKIDVTLTIVTKDREEIFESLLGHLFSLEWLHWKIRIYDNSDFDVFNRKNLRLSEYRRANVFSTNSLDVKMFHIPDFISCRNEAVKHCDTEWMMILDDDDKLTDELRLFIESDYLTKGYLDYNDIDFVSFGMQKEGINLHWDHNVSIISNKDDSLSTFDKYEDSRISKVYTRNAANLYRSQVLRRCFDWEFLGCDDILPITDMYLESRNVLRINAPAQSYSSQNTVNVPKTKEKIATVDINMMISYLKLIKKYINNERALMVIHHSICNSIKQLNYFDNYYSYNLKELADNCSTLYNYVNS